MSKTTVYLTKANAAPRTVVLDHKQFYSRNLEVDTDLAKALFAWEAKVRYMTNVVEEWNNRATRKDFDVNTIMNDEIREILCLSTHAVPREEKLSTQDSPADSNTPSTSSSKKPASKKRKSATKKKPTDSGSPSTEGTGVKSAEKPSASSSEADTPPTSS